MPNPILPRRSFTPNAVPIVSTDISAPGELLINWADGKAFTKDSAGNLITLTLGGSGGGGSLITAATVAGFPATGSASVIYAATDTRRLYGWDSSGVYVELGPQGGAGVDLSPYFVPGAPTNVAGTAGNAQVALTWTASSAISQIPVTDYVVQYSSDSGSTWTTFADGTSASASATVTGLTNGTAYKFRIAGVNAVGQGAWSAASGAVSPTSFTVAALSPSLWLDASLASSLYDATSGGSLVAGGGVVRRWEDQSGNANHVTGTNGPTRLLASIGGRDSLAFSNQSLKNSSFNLSGATAATLFAVIKFTETGNQFAVSFGSASSYGALILGANRTATQYGATFGSSSNSDERYANGGTVTSATVALGGVFSSNTGTLYINGTSSASVSVPYSLNSSSGISLGSYFDYPGLFWLAGSICEIVYLNRAATSTEISQMQTYFANKWGL